jgi:hypothetical protein
MAFEQDLFISYAHIDNQPLTAEQQGWVTRFHATLAAQLSMRLGSVARIWRDDKLRGNDVFADEIVQQFASTALLVSVLSPRYLASDWCRRELHAFCAEAARSGGLALGNKARVFKVIKTPVDSQTGLPQPLRDSKGYEFFTEADGAPLELDPAYGVKYSEGYFRMVGILAWELSQLLKALQAGNAAAKDAAAPDADRRPAVYLAECTADRRDVRTTLEAELKLHGVQVLPDRMLSRDDEARYVTAVGEMLRRCALSIHLVGEVYGAVPDGEGDKSITVLQNELAAAQCRAGGLTRLLWLPEGTASSQPQQQAFIRRLLEDDEAQFGADLLTGDVEELKATMHATLKKLERPAAPVPAAAGEAAPQVLLLCIERDRKATVPLRRGLKDKGFEVVLPAFEGGAAEVREANERQLATCDAVLLYYGGGDEAWKRTTDNELAKRRAQGGAGGPVLFTWLADPPSADKDDLFDMAEPGLIDGRAGFDAALLRPLVAALETKGST